MPGYCSVGVPVTLVQIRTEATGLQISHWTGISPIREHMKVDTP